MAEAGKYDDTRLRLMFESLSEKHRRQALRGGFRKAAMNVRSAAVQELRSSGLRSNRDVEKGIRAVVYKKVLGFKTTVGTKKHRVNYGDKSGKALSEARHREKLRIVPLWAEGGTAERRTTRTTSVFGHELRSKGRGRRTGAMPAFRFMERTKSGALENASTDLQKQLVTYVEKTALKYGGVFK